MVEDNKDLFVVKNQECPACGEKKAVFTEYETEDPYCGPIAIFSIKCEACGYKNSDLEIIENGTPAEYSLEIENPQDLSARVIKSGACEIKIPSFRISVDSDANSEGYVTNIEGLINRFKKNVSLLKDDPDISKEERKKVKNILKNIDKVLFGEKKIKIVLRDTTGNSAIISDKVQIKKLKKTD